MWKRPIESGATHPAGFWDASLTPLLMTQMAAGDVILGDNWYSTRCEFAASGNRMNSHHKLRRSKGPSLLIVIPWKQPWLLVMVVFVILFGSTTGAAADLKAARELFEFGNYRQCIKACEAEIGIAWQVDWRLLKIQSEMKLGNYKTALLSVEEALEKHRSDIRVRWLARTVYRYNNDLEKAEEMVSQIDQLARSSPWRYSDAEDRIVLGRMMLDANADARQVLELFFDVAKKVQPALVENYVVAADLALSKSDKKLAAKEAENGLKLNPKNPDLLFRLALSLWDDDRPKAAQSLKKALEFNPVHDQALLYQSNQRIDQEDYDGAKIIIEKVLKTNSKNELALAQLAVIAHLKGDYQTEESLRNRALNSWPKNPHVDHSIGKKLSQKYRFKEGAEYQRKALAFDPGLVPAKIQLAQDLLRLGLDGEGWELVAEANEEDQYNILMHNLQTLHDEISSFTSLEEDGIVVRMSVSEARLYGPEVLKLLVEAKNVLSKKYDYQFTQPVYVEIFPRQSDFAIRTFGMPGGAGFLGVCFGHLITANSPATQTENPTNWKSVLWHEFCHAVTLGKTNNRMPRWLSEGISVYEERQRSPNSGEQMSPVYRKMILSSDLTPVSNLSAAFLQAKSPIHLQFAYYESSLVIEYLMEKHGIDTLKKILVDLGAGIPINETLQRHTGSLSELDTGFKQFAEGFANAYAPEVDFSEPGLDPSDSAETVVAFLGQHPGNFDATLQLALRHLKAGSNESAKTVLNALAGRFADAKVHPAVLKLLARAHQNLGDTEAEIKSLLQIFEVSDDDLEACKRLIELQVERKDWDDVRLATRYFLSINPLQVEPHRVLAEAGEALNDAATTVRALECLLEFETTDLASAHYRIARIKLDLGEKASARRHVLQSLEEAPRYRDALEMLLKINSLE